MRHLVLVDDGPDRIELVRLAMHSPGIDRPVATFVSGEDCVAAIESDVMTPGLIQPDVNLRGLDCPATDLSGCL